jgi:toxin secretion/phage lysis holin
LWLFVFVPESTRDMRYFDQPWFLAVGGVVGFFASLTGMQLVIVVLLAMMVIDVVVGVSVAAQNGELSSKKSFQGGLRKVNVLAIVLATWLIQSILSIYAYTHLTPYFANMPATIPLAEFVGSYFILYTFISILENAVKGGVKLPGVLAGVLKIDSQQRKTDDKQ